MAGTPGSVTLRIFVYGRVQGVNYRRWFQGEAAGRGLSGWVRNCDDGSVEALLHGDPGKISDMVRAGRHGPVLARVDKVHTEAAQYDGTQDFQIK